MRRLRWAKCNSEASYTTITSMPLRPSVVLFLFALGCGDAPESTASGGQSATESSGRGDDTSTAGPAVTSTGSSSGASASASTSDDGTSDATGGTSSGGSGTTTDGGETSSGADDSSGGQPTTCGVEADGCCSDLVFGGMDPDCPAFDCDIPTLTEPIVLPETTPRFGGTAMAWSGQTLFTMRLDAEEGNVPTTDWWYVLEERDADGALQSTTTTDCGAQCGVARARTSLAYHAATDRLGFTTPRGSGYRLAIFERSGELVLAPAFGESASTPAATSKVTAFSGGFAVGSNDLDGSVFQSAGLRRYDVDGAFIDGVEFGDTRPHGSTACGSDCDEMVAIYEFGSLAAGVFDAVAGEAESDVVLADLSDGGLDHTAVVFDGEAYVVLASARVSVSGYSLRAGRWSPQNGWLNLPGALPTFGPRGYQPSAVWTGQSVIMAVQTFPVEDTPTGEPDPDRIHIYHLGPDGVLRGQFMLEDVPGYLPQLAYVDGRVAITWLRRPSQQPFVQERLLAFLECGGR